MHSFKYANCAADESRGRTITDARSASTRDNKPEDVGGIVTKARSVTNYHRRIRGQTQGL